MDPSWETCPHCEAEQRFNLKTVAPPPVNSAGEVPEVHEVQSQTMADPQNRPEARVQPDPAAPSPLPERSASMARDRTMTPGMQSGDPSDDPSDTTSASANRKIAAVLFTASWRSQGQLFPLYEGRNVIGRATVDAEENRPVDVQIPDDTMMSNIHAIVRCRPGTSTIDLFDNVSTNGTFYKGAEVESAGVKLEDGARFTTGKTEWQVKKIDWTPAPAAPPVAAKNTRATATKVTRGRGPRNVPE